MMTEANRQLGRYELFRRIAKGGMGEIYLAKTRGAGGFEKTIIIKTILPHLAEEEEFVTKFLDEGHIVTNLSHGNIVPVFDMGEEDGEYFMAMEYIPGRDLRAILKELDKQGERMPVDLALHVTAEVCKGLGYAHRKADEAGRPLEIVHRDVSPSNVLISREGEVKIIDFGIARAAGRLSKTVSGRIQGKFCYMSPEQASGKNVDSRGDVFSTGVVLYEMLTGVRPFEGDSDLETLDRVRECIFDPPSVLNPEVDDELDAIVLKTLAKHANDRYQAIDELHVELIQHLYGLGQAVTGHQVSNFLCALFPNAQPPEDPDRGSAKALDLEAALNLEFDKLGLDTAAEAALAQTHTEAKKPEAGPARHTATFGADAMLLTPAPTTASEGLPKSEQTPEVIAAADAPEQGPSKKSRNVLILTSALAALIALILVASVYSQTATGTLLIESDPPGARIALNGAQLIGVTTPHELDLKAGEHSLQLILDAHEGRTFRVQIEKGARIELTAAEARLAPVAQAIEQPPVQPKPRHFEIVTEPVGALIRVNGELIGESPQQVETTPGDVLNLSVSRAGCAPMNYTLAHGHASRTVHLELVCQAPALPVSEPVAARSNSQPNNSASPGRKTQRRIQIDSSPPGATIQINGSFIGQTPVAAPFPVHETLDIRATLEGHQEIRLERRPLDLDEGRLHLTLEQDARGCLDFRAISPAYNEIAINGRWLSGRHMKLENHTLTAGRHTLTVRNREAEREETFSFNVEAGENCAHLVVWEH